MKNQFHDVRMTQMELVFVTFYFTMASILSSSSLEKEVCPMIPILSKICSGFEAPISTLVTWSSFKIQLNAISASV